MGVMFWGEGWAAEAGRRPSRGFAGGAAAVRVCDAISTIVRSRGRACRGLCGRRRATGARRWRALFSVGEPNGLPAPARRQYSHLPQEKEGRGGTAAAARSSSAPNGPPAPPPVRSLLGYRDLSSGASAQRGCALQAVTYFSGGRAQAATPPPPTPTTTSWPCWRGRPLTCAASHAAPAPPQRCSC